MTAAAHTFVSSRRRTIVVAVALAVVVGAAALVVVDGTEAPGIAPVSAATAAPAAPVPLPATATLTAAAPAVAEHPVIATTPGGDAPAEAAGVDDPYTGAIVEPVDPAEVLFADHAAVAVSD